MPLTGGLHRSADIYHIAPAAAKTAVALRQLAENKGSSWPWSKVPLSVARRHCGLCHAVATLTIRGGVSTLNAETPAQYDR